MINKSELLDFFKKSNMKLGELWLVKLQWEEKVRPDFYFRKRNDSDVWICVPNSPGLPGLTARSTGSLGMEEMLLLSQLLVPEKKGDHWNQNGLGEKGP